MGAIIVTGIPGVGKTTVMEGAASQSNLEIVNYGDVMFKVAKSRGYVQDRDEMRKMPPNQQREVQKMAAQDICMLGDVVVDTHCTIKTPKGYLPGLPAWVLEALRPDSIVLVEAGDEEIHRRRDSDGTRQRDADSLEAIAEHQEINRRFAAAYATLTGATVHTVQNHDDAVDAAVEQLVPVMA